MERFKVGDKVRILTGDLRGSDAVISAVFSQGYSVRSDRDPDPIWYLQDELEPVYKPERLAEWEIELLFDSRDNGTIYEKVCKERGTIPENWM